MFSLSCRILSAPIFTVYHSKNILVKRHFSSSPSKWLPEYPTVFVNQLLKRERNPVFFDLRSDTETRPTDEMFDVMRAASRGDDVYGEDESTNDLEAYMAELTGHEAALFAVSSTMTNQLAIRAYLAQPPNSVLLDASSHIYNWEAGGIASHSQALVIPVEAKNKEHLTAVEIESRMILSEDFHCAPTRLICLENTLDGIIFPLSEIEAISKLARKNKIKLHLDGARLWNASAETGIELKEYGQNFDSITLCLSKGIGAPIGSVLVGKAKFISMVRHLRKMFGGGWRQSGSLAAVGNFAIRHTYPNLIKETHVFARKLAAGLQKHGIKITRPVHTNMVFIDTTPMNISIEELRTRLEEQNILISSDTEFTTRIVLHYQITEEAIDKFLDVVANITKKNSSLLPPL
ncbi:hypothetical protein G9A89_019847 [Geosiphon pyriformis]|nr:hypothetical protein G9A89_019847 [Geosiphon pyriformis]